MPSKRTTQAPENHEHPLSVTVLYTELPLRAEAEARGRSYDVLDSGLYPCNFYSGIQQVAENMVVASRTDPVDLLKRSSSTLSASRLLIL